MRVVPENIVSKCGSVEFDSSCTGDDVAEHFNFESATLYRGEGQSRTEIANIGGAEVRDNFFAPHVKFRAVWKVECTADGTLDIPNYVIALDPDYTVFDENLQPVNFDTDLDHHDDEFERPRARTCLPAAGGFLGFCCSIKGAFRKGTVYHLRCTGYNILQFALDEQLIGWRFC
jgi:hypothetical protein